MNCYNQSPLFDAVMGCTSRFRVTASMIELITPEYTITVSHDRIIITPQSTLPYYIHHNVITHNDNLISCDQLSIPGLIFESGICNSSAFFQSETTDSNEIIESEIIIKISNLDPGITYFISNETIWADNDQTRHLHPDILTINNGHYKGIFPIANPPTVVEYEISFHGSNSTMSIHHSPAPFFKDSRIGSSTERLLEYGIAHLNHMKLRSDLKSIAIKLIAGSMYGSK